MAKYSFDQLGSDRFEQLAQALLETLYRTSGELTQFGQGKDGAREATWTQPSTHPKYSRPATEQNNVDKQWVFQAKYHDVGLRGWDQARAQVESELASELDKLINKYNVPCHKYVLLTNVPFTGVRHVGTRDRVNRVISEWKAKVPEIEVWDASDLSRMLDANRDVRTTFLGDILPGDLLRQLYEHQESSNHRLKEIAETYLRSIVRSERLAKSEEAGDESSLQLERVYVDLDLKVERTSLKGKEFPLMRELLELDHHPDLHHHDDTLPPNFEAVPASFAFLRAGYSSMLLKGGPGVGKSTITQFVALYYAARLVEPSILPALEKHLKLRGESQISFDHSCRLRFPVRIELRRYAQWIADPRKHGSSTFLSSYIAEIIGKSAAAPRFDSDAVFSILRENPTVVILDGLDEVPNAAARATIFQELVVFLDRCQSQNSDVQVILSTRPQGYRGEFDGFSPIEWTVSDLNQEDFFDYSERWLVERIHNIDEREDARSRVKAGMQSPAVQQMATTLLQATVMLTIVRQKHAIPHARHRLFEKYVEVIFAREESKQTVKEHFEVLRRLHELVAYRLIQRMESAATVQTLGGEEFANCIRQVVVDYGSRGTIEEYDKLVESIQTSTKDRLCLLAGKGSSQEEVDFVIQPFREFFAASFLFRNELANPERVYSTLVRRKNVWGNVLQFYCAFQTSAQQRNWIAEADGKDVKTIGFERVSELVRRRRALLSVLPEFDRPKNAYIERAFSNILDQSTLWSWRYREDTPVLLSAFGGTESFSIASEIFRQMETRDNETLQVKLWLTTALSSQEERNLVRKYLQSHLGSPNAPLALQVALEYNIDLEVSSERNETLAKALDSWSVQRLAYRNQVMFSCFKGLSDSRVVELVFRDTAEGRWRHYTKFKKPWINKLFASLFRSQNVVEIGPTGIVAFRTAIPEDPDVAFGEVLAELDKLAQDSEFAVYLHALVSAMSEPANIELRKHAQLLELSVCLPPDSLVSVNSQLGPGPELFQSEDAWASFREKWCSPKSALSKLYSVLDEGDTWIAMFFKPSVWRHLSPILGADRTDKLSQLVDLNESDAVYELLGKRIVHYQGGISFDTKLVCEVALDIAIDRGLPTEVDFQKLELLSSIVETTSLDGAANILSRLVQSGTTKKAARFCISECATFTDVDASQLYGAWEDCGRPTLAGRLSAESDNGVLQRLFDLPQENGKLVAAQLVRDMRRRQLVKPRSIDVKLAKYFCDYLRSTVEQWTDCHLENLLRLTPSVFEMEIWKDSRSHSFLNSSEWLAERIEERFLILASAATHERFEIRDHLGVLVENTATVPLRIRVAALDAILRVDEILTEPLNDSDWMAEER